MKTAIVEIGLALFVGIFAAAAIAGEPEPIAGRQDDVRVAEFSSIAVGPVDETEEHPEQVDKYAWPVGDPKATKERLKTKVRHFGH